ncbi:zinc-dependent metalloprotease [Myxococcus sp. AM010]|uniref:zinc-dependent metalloprotease n=1 Tax=Myxococcus sp. AM010 TaxID=2745138 RepID=UPI0015954A26|nr:zinc-dependent metalloprotease [Myxococcus sp. AM010]NVJ15217.1 zinc-dependent metalloprotease [Myxococcus sp. AM010]
MFEWSTHRRRAGWGALSLTLALGTGCGGGMPEPTTPPPEAPEPGLAVELAGDFVAIPRELSKEQRHHVDQKLGGVVEDAGKSFYLAIRRSELRQRWFLTAFAKQYHPGGVGNRAGEVLGSRVVSFEEQNGKLFVFDVDKRKVMSDVFDPQILVEAYPIVTDYRPFNRLPGASQYVLIDPTAGLNRYGVVGDRVGQSGVHLQVELSFAQRFRRLADGVAYEQVFTGYADLPWEWASYYGEDNAFRTAGTLAISLRKYKEGQGYTPTPLPPRELYFRSDRRLVPNTTAEQFEQVALKWNIHPGMKPIRWHIMDTVLAAQQDPRLQPYDVVGAMKRGIEGWNAAFGFPVFEAVVGGGIQDFADDDRNVVIFDTDELMPMAFANWRSNPITGEIRGASVYHSVSWLLFAVEAFAEEAPLTERVAELATAPPAPRLRLSWSSLEGTAPCELSASDPRQVRARLQASAHPRLAALTQKQKVEAHITHVMLHEVGHTLGLRHNFSGSRVNDGSPNSLVSTSVMDYLLDEDRALMDAPGVYDVRAVRYLYGLSSELPATDAFCSDDDRRVDPYCATYDRFGDSLMLHHGPVFQGHQDALLTSPHPWPRLQFYFDYVSSPYLGFLRLTDPASQATAYALAMQKLRPPLVIPPGARPDYAARADELTRRIFQRLYLDPASSRGSFTSDPPPSPALLTPMLADIEAIVLNTDGVRSHAARRTLVDVLKAQQSLGAYLLLRELRDSLNASLPSLPPEEQVLTEDLVTRISVALAPYYR